MLEDERMGIISPGIVLATDPAFDVVVNFVIDQQPFKSDVSHYHIPGKEESRHFVTLTSEPWGYQARLWKKKLPRRYDTLGQKHTSASWRKNGAPFFFQAQRIAFDVKLLARKKNDERIAKVSAATGFGLGTSWKMDRGYWSSGSRYAGILWKASFPEITLFPA